MIISLEDLAAKKVKPAEGMTVSDNKVDLSKFTGSEVIFTGKYTKGINLIARPQIEVTFKDAIVDNGGTNQTLKVDGVYDQFKLAGVNAKFFGKSGNAASQMIYFIGTWSNVKAGGFEIDQRRDNKTGSTTTGACIQFAGVLKAGHSLGGVHIYDMVVYNAGDEGCYVNHFDRGSGYATGENLLVEKFKVFGSGRDFQQEWGFRNVIYRNCYGENGGKEADSNHCSAISANGWAENLLIEDCDFKNVAQLLYSGSPEPGKSIKGIIGGVRYEQGTHAGARNNQALYLKGPGEYKIDSCKIIAPSVKEAAITADGSKVIVSDSVNITAPKLSRVFNGGSVVTGPPQPVIKRYPVTAEVVETTLAGATTRKLLFEGKEFVI